MLNKELSHFSESKSGNQISEYICNTFLGEWELLLYRSLDFGAKLNHLKTHPSHFHFEFCCFSTYITWNFLNEQDYVFQFRAQHFYCLKDIAISYEKRCLVPVTSNMKLERVETQFPSLEYREYLKP